MRIMTSNIWGDYFNNSTIGRDDKLYGVYQKYAPDVIGFQEVTKGWYESSLFEKLSKDYYFIGTELFGSKNYVPMALKKELILIAKGFEYLENTPDSSKAITWAVVKQNGIVFALCNTHFWWMRGNEAEFVKKHHGVLDFSLEDHDRLRAKNAEQLSRLMKHLHGKYGCPVFAFGDMNGFLSEELFAVYRENGVKALFDIADERDTVCSIHGDPEKDENGFFHGKKASEEYLTGIRARYMRGERMIEGGYGYSIDHIVGLGENFSVKQYRVIEDQAALDASDHSPVFADVAL